jgi:hypothetical protein
VSSHHNCGGRSELSPNLVKDERLQFLPQHESRHPAPARQPFQLTGATSRAKDNQIRRARVLEVRIHLPPADSPSLSRTHFRASRTRAFPAGVRGSLDDAVSRDAAGFPLRVNRRQCLCRAIFQYRSAAGAVAGNATTVRTKSGVSGLLTWVVVEFGSGSSKAEQDPLVGPGKRQTRVLEELLCR